MGTPAPPLRWLKQEDGQEYPSYKSVGSAGVYSPLKKEPRPPFFDGILTLYTTWLNVHFWRLGHVQPLRLCGPSLRVFDPSLRRVEAPFRCRGVSLRLAGLSFRRVEGPFPFVGRSLRLAERPFRRRGSSLRLAGRSFRFRGRSFRRGECSYREWVYELEWLVAASCPLSRPSSGEEG